MTSSLILQQCDDLRSWRMAVMRGIVREMGWQNGVAWSIWSARETFEDRTSARLKAYNQNFCLISDVPNPGHRRLNELVPQHETLSFLTCAVRADCFATSVAVALVNDHFYLSGLNESAGNVTRVSRVGRLHYIYTRQSCIRVDGKVYEIVCAELPYPAGVRPTVAYVPLWRASLQEPSFSIVSSPLTKQPRMYSSRDRGSPTQWVEETAEKAMRPLKKNRIPLNFVCTTCHVTSTPEARIGPQGPATLCNRCGIRWAKAQEQPRFDLKLGEKLDDESKSPD